MDGPSGERRPCPPVKLTLGCGPRRIPGSIGVDIAPAAAVNLLCDLNQGLPFRDNCVDEIYAYHLLEHLDDFMGVMAEIWRVSRPNARVFIKVPHGSSSYVTWKDPTHKRGMFITSFAYFDDTYLEGLFFGYYSSVKFRIERAHLSFSLSRRKTDLWPVSLPRRIVRPILNAVANKSRRYQYFCERFWGPLVGMEEARVILRVLKE
jgi:ubiquinone/menaquinone biosynthesis C-methylase UbiE